MSMNRVNITGRLARDPELTHTRRDTAVLSFCVAVNDDYRNPETGAWESRPNWIDCALFGPRANSLSNLLRKGTLVGIDGRLRWSQWAGRDGINRTKVDVVVTDIQLLSSPDGTKSKEEPVVAGVETAVTGTTAEIAAAAQAVATHQDSAQIPPVEASGNAVPQQDLYGSEIPF